MFYGFVITEAGNNLLANIVAGQTLTITKVIMDKGTVESANAARQLTAPIDPGPDGTSTMPTVEGNTVNMIVEYRSDLNGGLQEGFWIGGFCVYGKVGDGTETLIYYGSLGDQKQYVSAYAEGTAPDVRRYPVSIVVTAGVEVEVTYPAEAWMSADDVAVSIKAASPHRHSYTLAVASWSGTAGSYSQTTTLLGVTADNNLCWGGVTATDKRAISRCRVDLTAAADGTLTWSTMALPVANIAVYVINNGVPVVMV